MPRFRRGRTEWVLAALLLIATLAAVLAAYTLPAWVAFLPLIVAAYGVGHYAGRRANRIT